MDKKIIVEVSDASSPLGCMLLILEVPVTKLNFEYGDACLTKSVFAGHV